MSLGAMFVGAHGATASTTIAGLVAMTTGAAPEQFGLSGVPPFSDLNLPKAADIKIGGWDLFSRSIAKSCRAHAILPREMLAAVETQLDEIEILVGYAGSNDVPAETANSKLVTDLTQAAEQVASDVRAFQQRCNVEKVVVVYLGSPPKPFPAEWRKLALAELEARIRSEPILSGALCYAVGATIAGASFIDFTPSDTLEFDAIEQLSESRNTQLIGRDGSTGQTMLKVALGGLFRRRNVHVDGWYSTNILGNNDGRVLMLPDHRVIKLHDKSDSLGKVLGYDDFDHVVTIDYFPSHGDRKESWDAVEATGWLGNKISLRINWRADDSLLAAPMILDLVRFCSIHPARPGMQPQFGFYFKHPLGGVADYSLDALYAALTSWARHEKRTN